MSHEIRTPMSGVIGLTGLLLDTPLDDVQRRYATGVRGAGQALLGIIDDILDFSKLKADMHGVQLKDLPFDPRLLPNLQGQRGSRVALSAIEDTMAAITTQVLPHSTDADSVCLRVTRLRGLSCHSFLHALRYLTAACRMPRCRVIC